MKSTNTFKSFDNTRLLINDLIAFSKPKSSNASYNKNKHNEEIKTYTEGKIKELKDRISEENDFSKFKETYISIKNELNNEKAKKPEDSTAYIQALVEIETIFNNEEKKVINNQAKKFVTDLDFRKKQADKLMQSLDLFEDETLKAQVKEIAAYCEIFNNARLIIKETYKGDIESLLEELRLIGGYKKPIKFPTFFDDKQKKELKQKADDYLRTCVNIVQNGGGKWENFQKNPNWSTEQKNTATERYNKLKEEVDF